MDIRYLAGTGRGSGGLYHRARLCVFRERIRVKQYAFDNRLRYGENESANGLLRSGHNRQIHGFIFACTYCAKLDARRLDERSGIAPVLYCGAYTFGC